MVRHHHISMFTHDLKENNQFYMDILGLRRVKITVNQNLPEMYHIFYGDTEGSAGNDFTFFDYSQYPKRKKGTNAYQDMVSLLIVKRVWTFGKHV